MLNAVITVDGEAIPRHRIERAIQSLIDMLDVLDGDTDLEPDLAGTIGWWKDAEGDDADLEASLGWTDRIAQIGSGWSGNDPLGLDREFDPGDECGDDTADLEPDTVEDGYQPLHLVDMADAA